MFMLGHWGESRSIMFPIFTAFLCEEIVLRSWMWYYRFVWRILLQSNTHLLYPGNNNYASFSCHFRLYNLSCGIKYCN